MNIGAASLLALGLLLPQVELSAPQVEDVRALLYRIDGEARVAFMHPDGMSAHAQAAYRFARDASELFDRDPGLRLGGEALERAGRALAEAARRNEAAEVRAAAQAVQAEVRRLDGAMPPAGTLP